VVERRTVIVAPLKRPALLNQKRGRKNWTYMHRTTSKKCLWRQFSKNRWPNMLLLQEQNRPNNFRLVKRGASAWTTTPSIRTIWQDPVPSLFKASSPSNNWIFRISTVSSVPSTRSRSSKVSALKSLT
jgi:hypothetical protein